MFGEVEKIVGDYFEVSPEEIRGKNRNMNCSDARHFVWHILHYILGYKVSFIAKVYGVTRRNVYYSITQIHEGIRMQPFYEYHYRNILKELKDSSIIN